MSAKYPGVNTAEVTPYEPNLGGHNLVLGKTCTASVSSYSLHTGNAPFQYRVVGLRGVMTGAGGAGNTVQLTDKAGNAITEAINVAGLAANAVFTAQTIDATYATIEKWVDDLLVVTTGGATCIVLVDIVKYEETIDIT
jgi:hypothetical protein